MDVKNPNKIKFKEAEDVRASFNLKGKEELVVLTDKRIYFAGKSKKGFMKKNLGIEFINLDSVIAGSRTKQSSGWPMIFIVLFGLIGLIGVLNEQVAANLPQFATMINNITILQENIFNIGIGGLVLAAIFVLIKIKSTKKLIVLRHMGGEDLKLPMTGKSDEEISSYLDIIADGIDG